MMKVSSEPSTGAPSNSQDQEESDTDSEAEMATGIRTKRKRPHFTNDELLYDPDMDENDSKWIEEKRTEARGKAAKSGKNFSVLLL